MKMNYEYYQLSVLRTLFLTLHLDPGELPAMNLDFSYPTKTIAQIRFSDSDAIVNRSL